MGRRRGQRKGFVYKRGASWFGQFRVDTTELDAEGRFKRKTLTKYIAPASGPARGCVLDWMLRIVWQCQDVGVPVFVKQAGSAPSVNYYTNDDVLREYAMAMPHKIYSGGREWSPPADGAAVFPKLGGSYIRIQLHDKKGGDVEELPPELRVREVPS